MAKQTPSESLFQAGNFLAELGNLMVELSEAVRDQRQDDIDSLTEDLPSKKEITKNLVLLGKVLESQPWKKVKFDAGRTHTDS